MLGMSVRKTAILIAATVLLSAGAGVAQAADKGKGIDFTVRTEASAIAPGTQTFRWDAVRGRWGLMLNMQQPDSRGIVASDIQAGAYYRVTPSLRVGVRRLVEPVLPNLPVISLAELPAFVRLSSVATWEVQHAA